MRGGKYLFFKNWLFCCFIMCVFTLALGSTPVFAADEEPEDEFMLEEITVTAEKREAELQKIPMEISVLRMDDMRVHNVNQVYDLQRILPDVSAQAQVGSFILISIREVETNLFNPLFETTVSSHLDGIQLTRAGGMDNFFFDLERVEVLKGPQGTLYGRGSTAGSMNMITKKPVLGEFGGTLSQEIGNYSRYRSDVALNVPMGDKFAMRFAGRKNKFDGYSDSGYGDADSWSGRLSLRWEPNDRASFDMMGDYVESYSNGYSMFVDEGYHLTTYGDIEIVAQTSEAVTAPQYQSGGPVYSRFQSRWAFGNALDDNYNDFDQYGIQTSFDYDFDFATLSIDYGYRAQHEFKSFIYGGAYLYPAPFSPGAPPWVPDDPTVGGTISEPYTQVALRIRPPSLFTNPTSSSHTNTMEIRLTSNTTIAGGDTLEWIAGVMGQRDAVTETVNMQYWGYFAQIKTETEGAFVQASWMPIDKWNFTAGVRQNWDKKDYWGIGSYPSDPITYLPDSSPDNFNSSTISWSETTYRANISYIPNENMMPYLTYSRGYRSGNLDYGGNVTPPEFLNSFEFGFKSRWFDSRLQVNAGLYYYDYENYNNWTGVSKCYRDTDNFGSYTPGDHYCDDVGGDPSRGGTPYDQADNIAYPDGQINNWDYEYNIGYVGYSPGGAEQKGISVNIQYMPTMDDMVTFNGTWRNNEYGNPYDARAALLDLYPDADSPWRDQADKSGDEFGGAPIRFNAGYNHTFRLDNGDTMSAGGTLFYEGKGIDQYVNQGWDNEYTMPGRDAYVTVDLNFNYTSSRFLPPGKMWSIRASAQNILDNDALNSVTYSDDLGFTADDVYALGSGLLTGRYINPRTYSVTLEINF